MQLLILHLSRDHDPPVAIYSRDKDVLKFGFPGSSDPPTPINETDATIAQLDAILFRLRPSIAELEGQISQHDRAARMAVECKNRSAALSALKSRKLAESTVEKRRETLHQLQSLRLQIEDASTQVEMVRAMESSTSVLKNLNKAVGGVEGVEDVVDRLQEQLGISEDISTVISGSAQITVDEGAVEDELAEMEAEEKRKADAEKEKEAEKKRKAESEEKRPSEERIADTNTASSTPEKELEARFPSLDGVKEPPNTASQSNTEEQLEDVVANLHLEPEHDQRQPVVQS